MFTVASLSLDDGLADPSLTSLSNPSSTHLSGSGSRTSLHGHTRDVTRGSGISMHGDIDTNHHTKPRNGGGEDAGGDDGGSNSDEDDDDELDITIPVAAALESFPEQQDETGDVGHEGQVDLLSSDSLLRKSRLSARHCQCLPCLTANSDAKQHFQPV